MGQIRKLGVIKQPPQKEMIENTAILRTFLREPTVNVFEASNETAEIFGNVKNDLQKAGTPLPINDVWIAAHATEAGAVVVTYDLHFTKIPGLRLWQGLRSNNTKQV